jgi:hypothetical protein
MNNTKTITIKKKDKIDSEIAELLNSKEKVQSLFNKKKSLKTQLLIDLDPIRHELNRRKFNPGKLTAKNNKNIRGRKSSMKQKPKPKNRNNKTKKFTEHEVTIILENLRALFNDKNYKKFNRLLKKTTKEQYIQILSHYGIIKETSKAPVPLLKNLLFQMIIGGIYIII